MGRHLYMLQMNALLSGTQLFGEFLKYHEQKLRAREQDENFEKTPEGARFDSMVYGGAYMWKIVMYSYHVFTFFFIVSLDG